MKASLKIYRWQHKETGFGPLCGKTGFDWVFHFKHHESPCEDEGYLDFCRFFSEEQMKDYFFAWSSLEHFLEVLEDGAEDALEECGFEFTEWEVHEDYVLLKDGQVLFNRSKAVRIN